ncbi:MAG: hypothetical protein ACRD19_07230 [Terriglobia bacterium]
MDFGNARRSVDLRFLLVLQFDISVKLKSNRSCSTNQIIAEVRSKITQQEPGIHLEFGQILQDMIGDLTSSPQPLAIKLFSGDDALPRHWAPIVGTAIAKTNGVVDVLNGIDPSGVFIALLPTGTTFNISSFMG